MSGKPSDRRTKSGCICRQYLTEDSPSAAASTSHLWLRRKDFNSSRFAEAPSTSMIAGFMLPRCCPAQGGTNRPPPSRNSKILEGLVLSAITNPSFRRPLPPLTRDKKRNALAELVKYMLIKCHLRRRRKCLKNRALLDSWLA